MAQSKTNDSEVHSGARGTYNSIEELMNWMGTSGQIICVSYCCDGRCIAEDDETQPTDRKWKKTAMLADEANTNSAIFRN